MRSSASGAIAALACCALASCAWLPIAPRAIGHSPGPLGPTEEIEGEFVVQHRLRVVADDVDFPLQSVLQKRQNEIVFIGLGALGEKLFSVKQQGVETQVDSLPAAVLPIPPLNLLRDLHRVLFLEAPRSGAGAQTIVEVSERNGRAQALLRHAACDYSLEVEELERRAL
jgi:hypothetical protein